MPTYPSTLPQPNSSGYNLDAKKNKEEFVAEFGNRRQRRFVTAQVYVVQLRFDFKNKAEYDAFLKWLKYDIDYGNLWFQADFLLNEGFLEGEWVWRFAKINYNATGYAMGFSCTCLMGPRYSNIVSDDYVELGIEGSFFNQAIDFECEELDYNRVFIYGPSIELRAYDDNGSNWTRIGNQQAFSSYYRYGIACCKSDKIALVGEDQVATYPFDYRTGLRMYSFDGVSFAQLGATKLLNQHYSYDLDSYEIARMSNSVVVIIDRPLAELDVWGFNYGTNEWTQVGTTFNLEDYITIGINDHTAITYMGDNRIAFAYHHYDTFYAYEYSGLVVLEFDGSTWSQVGSPFEITIPDGSAMFSLAAISKNQIVLTHSDGSGGTYNKALTTFLFDGSEWTQDGSVSVQFSYGYRVVITAVSLTQIAVVTEIAESGTTRGVIMYDRQGNIWVRRDNGKNITYPPIAAITSYFEPQ